MFGKPKLKFWDGRHLFSKQEKGRLFTLCAHPSVLGVKSCSGCSIPKGLKLPLKTSWEQLQPPLGRPKATKGLTRDWSLNPIVLKAENFFIVR